MSKSTLVVRVLASGNSGPIDYPAPSDLEGARRVVRSLIAKQVLVIGDRIEVQRKATGTVIYEGDIIKANTHAGRVILRGRRILSRSANGKGD